MRITQKMMTDTMLTDLSNNNFLFVEGAARDLLRDQDHKPSDDPQGTAYALRLRATQAAETQYTTNSRNAQSWLSATESALAGLSDSLQRARELAVRGANGTMGPTEKATLGAEVDQILEHAVEVGNSKFTGQYLFAGLATGSEPFTLNAGPPTTLTYNGDTGMMTREVEEGVTMSVNIPGSTGFPAIIQSLIDLRDGLQNNDSAASRRPSAISTPA